MLALQAYQQIFCLCMAQHIGDCFLGNAKGGDRHFFGDAGQALLAFEAPVNGGVVQRAQQVCTQARFQAETGQLAWIEYRRNIAYVGQGLVQCAAQVGTVFLQVRRCSTLNQISLQHGSGQ
ncbi:hypothetical protein D3C80_1583410 [compost metagenome]